MDPIGVLPSPLDKVVVSRRNERTDEDKRKRMVAHGLPPGAYRSIFPSEHRPACGLVFFHSLRICPVQTCESFSLHKSVAARMHTQVRGNPGRALRIRFMADMGVALAERPGTQRSQ
jgi:hypothetical protein